MGDKVDLGYARAPCIPKVEFYMLVSPQHSQGEALLRVLNEYLRGLRERGELQALNKSYTN